MPRREGARARECKGLLFHLHGQEAEIPESVLTVWGCTYWKSARGPRRTAGGLLEDCWRTKEELFVAAVERSRLCVYL